MAIGPDPGEHLITRAMGVLAIAFGVGLGALLVDSGRGWIPALVVGVPACAIGLVMVLRPRTGKSVRGPGENMYSDWDGGRGGGDHP